MEREPTLHVIGVGGDQLSSPVDAAEDNEVETRGVTGQHDTKMRGTPAHQESSSDEEGDNTQRRTRLTCYRSISKKHIFGIVLLIFVDLINVGAAGLTRYLFKNLSYNKPFFTTYFTTVLFTIYLVPFVFWRPWQRLCCIKNKRRSSSRRDGNIQGTTTPSNVQGMPNNQCHIKAPGHDDGTATDGKRNNESFQLLSVRYVALLAIMFGVIWFFANYLYTKALYVQSVAVVNTLVGVSGIFVLVLSALPLPKVADKDKFTLTKLIITLISAVGAAMVGVSPSSDHTGGTLNMGALYTVAGALTYSFYLVLLYKVIPSPESLEIPMFFGFVGLFDAVLLLPGVVSWHYLGWEEFEWPYAPGIWTVLLVNGFIGTVLIELLWLWGALLTSSLVGTLSLSFVTPLSIIYSIIIGESHFSVLFFVGALFMVTSFVCVAIVDHWDSWDPLWLGLKKVVALAKDYRVHREYVNLQEESQPLLAS